MHKFEWFFCVQFYHPIIISPEKKKKLSPPQNRFQRDWISLSSSPDQKKEDFRFVWRQKIINTELKWDDEEEAATIEIFDISPPTSSWTDIFLRHPLIIFLLLFSMTILNCCWGYYTFCVCASDESFGMRWRWIKGKRNELCDRNHAIEFQASMRYHSTIDIKRQISSWSISSFL